MTDPDRAELLRAIHDAHGQVLLRYVLRLTRGERAFAEDVVQESLLRLWRKPELLEQCSDGVRAWLFTVARNQVIDDRRSARYARELQMDSVPERSSPDEIGPAFDKWILSDALMSLSADHRVVIVRAYYSAKPWPLSPNTNRFRRGPSNPGFTTRCTTGNGRCLLTDDHIAEWDAAYVLGALSRQDRSIYEAFLAANSERTAALGELAGLLGRLSVLSRDEALALI